jgi:hypothetical protein
MIGQQNCRKVYHVNELCHFDMNTTTSRLVGELVRHAFKRDFTANPVVTKPASHTQLSSNHAQ